MFLLLSRRRRLSPSSKRKPLFFSPWRPRVVRRNWQHCDVTVASCQSTEMLSGSFLLLLARQIVSLIWGRPFGFVVSQRVMTLLHVRWRRWKLSFNNAVIWTSLTTSSFRRRHRLMCRFPSRDSRRFCGILFGAPASRLRQVPLGRSASLTPSHVALRSTRCFRRGTGPVPRRFTATTFVPLHLWQGSECCRAAGLTKASGMGRRSGEEQLLFLFSLLLFPTPWW